MIIVEARKEGYYDNKIREIGDRFPIKSVQEFSKGITSRKGYERLGWMALVSISSDHKEETPELRQRLKDVVKQEKALKKQAVEDSDELGALDTVSLDDIDDIEEEPEPEPEPESVDNEATIEDNDPDVI